MQLGKYLVATLYSISFASLLVGLSGCGQTQLKSTRTASQGAGSQDATQAPAQPQSPRPLPLPSTAPPPEQTQKNSETGVPPSMNPGTPQNPAPLPQLPPPPPTNTFDIAKLVSKMTWSARYFNNKVNKIFTGYDGVNSYRTLVEFGPFGQLPADIILNPLQIQAVYSSTQYNEAAKEQTKKLSFTVADPTMVELTLIQELDQGRVYELISLKPGTTTAVGKFENSSQSISIQIASYTPAQVALGKSRYLNAVPTPPGSPACASCHIATTGADHSPYLMAQFSDAAILGSIELGVNGDDGYQLKVMHKLTFASPEEKAGIVPYLRSLDPKLLPNQQPQALKSQAR